MTDEPGFRQETNQTVSPPLAEWSVVELRNLVRAGLEHMGMGPWEALDELVERAEQSGESFQIGHRALMAMQERAEAAEALVATLEAALRYYAKEQNYAAGYVRRDRGRRARAALGSGAAPKGDA